MIRRIIPGLIVCATMTFAGCGGDDNPESSAPIVGYLAVGGVSGVHYQTATQSGNTDITGAFRYVPGETVRFSVGGIELGSVPGASQVTPFTLAGAAPATSEPALRRELDRAERGPTPFLRAVNITHFLMAFDADGSPDNGLDVTTAGSALANSTLNFNQGLFAFAPAVSRLPGEKNQNIPLWRPVEHLYRAIGVAVPAHMPWLEQTRGGIGRYPGADVSYTYRSDGLRESMGQDTDLDGVAEYGYSNTYDAMGRIISSRMQVGDFFEGIQYISESTTEFDPRGRYLRQEERIDERGDGSVDTSYENEVEGDRFTGVERQTTRVDVGADGVVDTIYVYEASVDAAQRTETIRARRDSDADGIFDGSYEEVYTFDALLRFESRTEERDDDGNGVVEYRARETVTYTDSPSTSRSEYTEDLGGDGTIDRTWVTVRTFDAAGNEQSRLAESDYFGADGVVDDHYTVEFTHDGDRRVLTSVRNQDYDANGSVDSRDLQVFTYSDIGNMLTARREYDFLADGVSDYRYEQRYEYGDDGERKGWMSFDLNSSATDPTEWMTADTLVMPDGVRALAQNYFEFNVTLAF